MKSFSVTSKHFSLYEAFRKEAESKGWVFNEHYGGKEFSEKAMTSSNCLHFSNEYTKYQNVPAFAFGHFNDPIKLETEWEKAVKMLTISVTGNIYTPAYIEVALSEIASWKKCDIEKIRIKL